MIFISNYWFDTLRKVATLILFGITKQNDQMHKTCILLASRIEKEINNMKINVKKILTYTYFTHSLLT